MVGLADQWCRRALALGSLSMAPLSGWACATCGCTLNTDAAMGYTAAAGWRLNVEYDYVNQDQLRSGTHAATPAQVVNQPIDPSTDSAEIEQNTLNRYLTVGIAYSPVHAWNFDLRMPYVLRGHTTFGQQAAPFDPSETAPDQLSSSRVSGLGDARFVMSYQGLLPTHNLGVQLGIKLPTGRYGTDVKFSSGPWAGTPLDASLQAGTGSTDLIVGAYYYRAVSQDFDAYATGQFQAAVAHRQNEAGNDFRPGNSLIASFGLRYEAHPQWVPQLQVNVLHKSADQGALADRLDTAGTVLYLSPGITVRTFSRAYLYGFIQVPVLSNLDGYQLFPHWTASVGVSYAL
jgi:hypothetical protein